MVCREYETKNFYSLTIFSIRGNINRPKKYEGQFSIQKKLHKKHNIFISIIIISNIFLILSAICNFIIFIF